MTLLSPGMRAGLLSAFATLSLLTATQAYAAADLTITQKSPVGYFGDWTLTQPSGGQVTVQGGEFKNFPITEAGTYGLQISPPADVILSVKVVKNGTQILATTLRNISFDLADGDTASVAITYSYNGTIIVDSDPQGATFELLGPDNMRLTGATPVTYTGFPPAQYRVTFMKQPDCAFSSPIQRPLGANETLTFMGKFVCGVATPLPIVPTPEPEPTPADESADRTLRIWAAAQQAEVVSGGVARYTITVKNTGTRTVHGLSVSAQFDPSVLTVDSPLPRFGSLNGDVASWQIPELFAGKYWSVTFPATVTKNLKQGDRAGITARVSAADTGTTDESLLMARTDVGVVGLPQTGMRFDLLFLVFSIVATSWLSVLQLKKATVRA
ncbi:MAG: hypothetical protein PHE68_04050 [Candidatus Peribacteraceae bacterium]|nr:hypothetical protein [Candidatus Peribacteraceae bacterium]MDD5074831.1 hypothetical protein [Candidatus Peribacteraceae bacterium]